MKKTENKFMKYFTIFLIIVFIIGIAWTWVIALFPSNPDVEASSGN